MARVLVSEDSLQNIADAIRYKNGLSTTYTPSEMADAIRAISGGGSQGVYVGTTVPDSSLGSNGDYYYKRKNEQYGFTWPLGQNSSTYISGYEFIPNQSITIIGLRGYTRNSTTGNMALVDTSGNIIKQTENTSFNVGWNYLYFDQPVQLMSGENYIVMINVNNSYLSYNHSSNVTFNTLITYVKGRYGSFPGTRESGVVYGSDIIIQGNVYIIEEQYYKNNGVWTQLT